MLTSWALCHVPEQFLWCQREYYPAGEPLMFRRGDRWTVWCVGGFRIQRFPAEHFTVTRQSVLFTTLFLDKNISSSLLNRIKYWWRCFCSLKTNNSWSHHTLKFHYSWQILEELWAWITDGRMRSGLRFRSSLEGIWYLVLVQVPLIHRAKHQI